MITDDQLAITCIADEAAGEPYEGKVCVGIVILNRKTIPYSSDRTMVGTVLHKWAFSGFWAGMEHGRYVQEEFDLVGAEARAQTLYEQFSAEAVWAECERAWTDAQAWMADEPMNFTPGPAFAGMSRDTVLYYNPAIVHTPPAWAIPSKKAAVIFNEVFYNR